MDGGGDPSPAPSPSSPDRPDWSTDPQYEPVDSPDLRLPQDPTVLYFQTYVNTVENIFGLGGTSSLPNSSPLTSSASDPPNEPPTLGPSTGLPESRAWDGAQPVNENDSAAPSDPSQQSSTPDSHSDPEQSGDSAGNQASAPEKSQNAQYAPASTPPILSSDLSDAPTISSRTGVPTGDQGLWRSNTSPSDWDDFGDKLNQSVREEFIDEFLKKENLEKLTDFARLGEFGRGAGSFLRVGSKALGWAGMVYELYEQIAYTEEDRKLRAIGEHQGQPYRQGNFSERIPHK
jgi:hypothetical protein